MKQQLITLLYNLFRLYLIFCLCIPVYSQIGFGTLSPDASSILHVSSSDQGVLFPRLTNVERDGILNPAVGLTIYNLDESCLQVNTGTPSSPVWTCSGGSSGSVTVLSDCSVNGFDGVYFEGIGFTSSNTFSLTLTNHTFSTVDMSFSSSDLVLSGVGGVSVSSVSVSSASIPSGGSQVVEYSLSGTPSSTGELTGVWTKLGLTCSRSVSVLPRSLFVDCSVNGFEGVYANGVSFTGTNIFSVLITNYKTVDTTITFSSSDLVLSGLSGVSVSSVSPSSSTIVSGGSQVVEYSLTGTPGSVGTLSGLWSNASYSCTNSVNVGDGDALFTLPRTAYVTSINDGLPSVDIQGVVDNGSNQLTVSIPYTDGVGTYDAYSGTYTLNNAGTGENGDVNSFRLTYPAGTFSASGSITATIEVDGDGSFNAEKQLFGVQKTIASLDFQVNGNSKGNVNLDVIGGIPDRNFADASHKFIYVPVLAADGNVWLNNNLGANYSNMNHAHFNPVKQATAYNDHHAYGSLFQWGRYSDGHELINWTSSTTGTGVNGTTSTNATSDTPGNNLFILEGSSPYDWRVPQNDNLWQGESGINNPCPVGYRLPTDAEMNALVSAEGITNYTTAASSSLAFSASGDRISSNGSVINVSSFGYYWLSSVVGTDARYHYFTTGTGTGTSSISRAYGFGVRCLKD